jgi:predicted naringenin-chalcone synthase
LTTAYLNRVATAVPPHDIHNAFVRFAYTLLTDPRERAVFERLVVKAQIHHRQAVFAPAAHPEGISVDAGGFYSRGAFPSTGQRMQRFEAHAAPLAVQAVDALARDAAPLDITHVLVTTCTGMYAPGLDLDLVAQCRLAPSVERTMIGFMGCYAALNALKLARHIVRSDPRSRVLIVNLELCSLHLQEVNTLAEMLAFLVFGDGCAASLVTAEPTGLALGDFRTLILPDTRGLITWKVRDQGFDMVLSGQVPGAIAKGLDRMKGELFGGGGAAAIDLWAVHPGGRSVLDGVAQGLALEASALAPSRRVLADHGNMSSATVMFVLADLLASAPARATGCAMSFGPGLTAETMLFQKV